MNENSRLIKNNDKNDDFKAPKDPVAKRDIFFVMLEKVIEATPRNEGKPSQEIYLDGDRLKSIAKLVGGVSDEEILTLLDNCEGFHKLVHSIGVIIKTGDEHGGEINFVLQNYGKEKKYKTGT